MAVVRPAARRDVQLVHIVRLAPGRFGAEGALGQHDVGRSLAVRLDRPVLGAGVRGVQNVGRLALGDDGLGRDVEGVVVPRDEDLGPDLGPLVVVAVMLE